LGRQRDHNDHNEARVIVGGYGPRRAWPANALGASDALIPAAMSAGTAFATNQSPAATTALAAIGAATAIATKFARIGVAINPLQHSVLVQLYMNEALTDAELAERVGVPFPELLRELAALDHHGLVRRGPEGRWRSLAGGPTWWPWA